MTKQANFYIVANESTMWGAGQTKDDAIKSAVEWADNADCADDMRALIESGKFYLEPITHMQWDDSIAEMGADELQAIVNEEFEQSA